jgi:hypothetical protein
MWDTNPYNSANGGFVDKAEKFFYNSACDAQIKNYCDMLLPDGLLNPYFCLGIL